MSATTADGRFEGSASGEGRLARMRSELHFALTRTDPAARKAWARRSALRIPQGIGRRAWRAGSLAVSVTKGVFTEAFLAVRAAMRGELGAHAKGRASAAADAGAEAVRSGLHSMGDIARRITSDPEVAAPELFALGVGFLVGSGGIDGDGGIPDLDLAPSIGWHRSILTHSIISGAVVEAIIASTLDLVLIVHMHLPAGHDPLWNKLVHIALRSGAALRIGVDLGIATHLLIDGTIDGMTPYKDLPVSLPLHAHQGILLSNAAAEAVLGLEGLRLLASSTTKVR